MLKWFKQQQDKQISITYKSLRAQIPKFELTTPLPLNFKVSDGFLLRWTRRHNIGRRCITHTGQVDRREKRDIAKTAKEHLLTLSKTTAGYDTPFIFNMDKTPCYFDMVRDSTLHFKGSKNVDDSDTGHRKSRFTVALTACMNGSMAKTLVIFRGLKKIPKVKTPKNIVVLTSLSGTMDTRIALQYINLCFASRGPYMRTTKSLLLWDSYGSHKKEEVIQELRQECGTQVLILPASTTSYFQLLNVAVNLVFKGLAQLEDEALVGKVEGKSDDEEELIEVVDIDEEDVEEDQISDSGSVEY
uniref:HTH CENPB-type domain-containing protein n=1 Tax=Plectus sambesii TaxID=2011161 RepID=A0A914WZG8_9BILA